MISVILPTYNPDLNRLQKVLTGLSHQTLNHKLWEIIIIDNNSNTGFDNKIDLSWQKNSCIIKEPKQGLTHARLKGISNARFEIILMVDDDNILEENYLSNMLKIFDLNPNIGTIGGKIDPEFESLNTELATAFKSLLAIRDLGSEIQIESFNNQYPRFAPVGAGMAFRKASITTYTTKALESENLISDRKGNSLSSSGDNEMVWEIFKSGWDIGYFPELKLTHIIPEARTTKEYLAKLNFQIQKSWVLFLLKHSLCPWRTISPLTVPLRKVKTWLSLKAWRNDISYIKWRGTCGTFNALATYKRNN